MSELITSTKLDPDQHIILDQPLLRLPHELLRKNLKSAQRQIEITNKAVFSVITVKPPQSPADTLSSLDATLAKAQNLKRKLEALHEEEKGLHKQQKARINHLKSLHDCQGLADVKYEDWSRVRLDRLLVDYLLRQGYTESARQLSQEKGIENLVDVGVFDECARVEKSLQRGEVKECLNWCSENKQGLKKMNSDLEYELRLQQFIELRRSGDTVKLMEAIAHARKHLATPSSSIDPETQRNFILKAGGLLANPPDTFLEPYRTIYSHSRWEELATLFVRTHHELFSLPAQPLLHTALSAGLSALKTPSCHSEHNPLHNASLITKPTSAGSVSNMTLTGTPICPICSTELNELARNVPYAHHTKSYMEEDPVVLPNGRVYGRERLVALNDKLGTKEGKLRDPAAGLDGEEWNEGECRKVFIS
ncbi:putative negative regulation of gluconeogenesis [Polychaeton citri CBS 116435]|uniref:Negative regulation of gluconeogenesis n=1 Tax=Polychaeton citri CBS 116435 TaxID=1314669 RepID=A0A9P4QGJ7_9PEZI|nr:putative negative regulation of gluconeogenesis [Polychaeton citri CBS 116435]